MPTVLDYLRQNAEGFHNPISEISVLQRQLREQVRERLKLQKEFYDTLANRQKGGQDAEL
jgi:hypothetical protein